jgi:hypothetical protein
LEKHHISNDATENAWFLSNLTSARKWSLEVNSHWAPFSCSCASVREYVIPLNPAGHLPVTRRGHSCSPPSALRAHTINRAHGAGGNRSAAGK